jgi:hypothetical protein
MPARTGPRALGVLAAALVWVTGSIPTPARQDASLEYRVKAAYLLNFARYVEWPEDAFSSASEPLMVCVAGEDPFGTVLDETFEGHAVGGRAVVARRIASVEQAQGCHVLFIGSPDGVPAAGVGDLARQPVLTVGESNSFLAAGGMVRFLIVEDTVRFEVNRVAAQRAGLRLSSRMLSFAWAVRPEG